MQRSWSSFQSGLVMLVMLAVLSGSDKLVKSVMLVGSGGPPGAAPDADITADTDAVDSTMGSSTMGSSMGSSSGSSIDIFMYLYFQSLFSIGMKSFKDISFGLLIALFVIVVGALYHASKTFCDEEDAEEKNQAILRQYLANYKPGNPQHDAIATLTTHKLSSKQSSRFAKIANASSSGILRGSIFGGLTGGIPGAVVGACVWGVVNPFITVIGF
jgi:hypothetical protein